MSKSDRGLAQRGNGTSPPPITGPRDEPDTLFSLGLQPGLEPSPASPQTAPTGTIFDDLDALALDPNADLRNTASVLSTVGVRRPGKIEPKSGSWL